MERLKHATELKFGYHEVMNSMHLLNAHWKKTRPCISVATPFKQFKAVTTRVFNKIKLKEVINWHLNNTK